MSNFSFIFFGSPAFAETFLDACSKNGFTPAMVVCNPDRPVGRKKKITSPLTKVWAQEHSVPVSQPESLRDNQDFKLQIPHADIAIVAAYAYIIPQDVLDLFPRGVIGVHPSLLPKYRGASPIQSSLLSGDTKTGVTLYLMDKDVDHGPMLSQKEVPIADQDTYNMLEKKLALAGAELFAEAIPSYINGSLQPQEQNHEEATLTKKIKTEDGFTDLEKDSALSVYRKIKALNPEPGAFTYIDGKRTKLLEVDRQNDVVVITKIIPEGKRAQQSKIELK